MRFGHRVRQPGDRAISRWLQQGLIKSIQRGTITFVSGTTATATITSVDPSYSLLVWLGTVTDQNQYQHKTRLEFTNATTITATRAADVGGSTNVTFEVVEFYPTVLRSVQRGTVTLSGATTGSTAISSVITQKSRLDLLGYTINIAGSDGSEHVPKLELTSATLVSGSKASSAAGAVVAGFQVAEFH